MDSKVCKDCKETKPIDQFRWKNKEKGIQVPRCRECDQKYRARYYRENREGILERNKRSQQRLRQRVRDKLVSEKENKVCSSCGRVKSSSEFRWNNKGEARRVSRCKECDKEYRSGLYQKNKESFLQNNKRQYRKLRVLIDEYKQGKPCVDCGQVYPSYVMDFDHIDGETKVSKVSSLVYSGSEQLILNEIAKCELVCANCHRIRTHRRRKGKEDGNES